MVMRVARVQSPTLSVAADKARHLIVNYPYWKRLRLNPEREMLTEVSSIQPVDQTSESLLCVCVIPKPYVYQTQQQ